MIIFKYAKTQEIGSRRLYLSCDNAWSGGKLIFREDEDREEFLNRLEKALKETGSKCYGWVLMPNHFHLIIRTLKIFANIFRHSPFQQDVHGTLLALQEDRAGFCA